MSETLTDEQRMRNLRNAAQDIRTLLETPRSHEMEGRVWRTFYLLDGFMRSAILVQVVESDGPSVQVRVRHDFPLPAREAGGPDATPEDLALFLGLDSIPEGKVTWKQDKSKTHGKPTNGKVPELIIPFQNPNLMLPRG